METGEISRHGWIEKNTVIEDEISRALLTFNSIDIT